MSSEAITVCRETLLLCPACQVVRSRGIPSQHHQPVSKRATETHPVATSLVFSSLWTLPSMALVEFWRCQYPALTILLANLIMGAATAAPPQRPIPPFSP